MSKIDWTFNNKYPRIYPIASVMGITKEWIDQIFDKMDYSIWMYEHLNHDSKQLHLSACMKRLHYFGLPFDFETYKGADIDTIEKVFGKYNVRFVVELMEVL